MGVCWGPPLQALILQTPFWIMGCNILLFLAAIQSCASVAGLSRTKLGLLLALNATTMVSLITLNKEIFALTASLLLCRYIYTEGRSWLLLSFILLVGLLARWQQTAMTMLFLFLFRRNSFTRRHPFITLLSFVAAITVAYPFALHFAGADLTSFTDQAKGGGAIVFLDRVQANFGFPLVLLPKAGMSLFGHLVTPWYWFGEYWHQDFDDLANQVVINLHCLAMLIIFIVALAKGRPPLEQAIAVLYRFVRCYAFSRTFSPTALRLSSLCAALL